MSKKSILKGTLIIACANILAKFIGVLFKIPLTEMIGEEGIGIYNFPYPLFLVFIAVSIAGPPVAIAKLISERRALNDYEGVRKIFVSALKLMFYIGVATTAVLVSSSNLIIRYWPSDALYPFLALTAAPLFLSLMAVFKGYYQGHQQMLPTAVAQTVDSAVRLVIGLGLAFLLQTRGIAASATGAAFGTTAGAVAGFIAILSIYLKDKNKYPKVELEKKEQNKLIMQILSISIPISIGAIGGTLMPLVDSFVIKDRLLLAGFSIDAVSSLNGVLSNANTIANLPLSIGVAIGINMVPSISGAKLISKDDVLKRIRSGLIMIISIALPASVGMFILSKQIFFLFFPSMSADHYLMEILSVGVFFIMLNQVFTSILQALDHINIPVRNIYIGAIIKIALSYTLISNTNININGAALSTVASFILITTLNIVSCYKIVKFKIDFKYMVILPIFNVSIMAISVLACSGILSKFIGSNRIVTVSSVVLGVSVYGILILVTKVVSVKSIPILNKIIRS